MPSGRFGCPSRPSSCRVNVHSLPYAEVGDSIEQVRGSGTYPATVLAFEFLVLTACRSGEVRGALWNEMDFEAEEWRIPAGRMKTHREHRVPLSGRALAVLREAQRLADGSGRVFPSYARTREHDSRSPHCNCAPPTVYSGARAGAGIDPLFLVEKLPRKGVLVALSPSVLGVAPSPPTARLIPAGRLLGADGISRAPILVEVFKDSPSTPRHPHHRGSRRAERLAPRRRIRRSLTAIQANNATSTLDHLAGCAMPAGRAGSASESAQNDTPRTSPVKELAPVPDGVTDPGQGLFRTGPGIALPLARSLVAYAAQASGAAS